MSDMILTTIWKVIKGAVLITLFVGLVNFLLTPGGVEEKMTGAYEKTAGQAAEVARIGKTVFVNESDNVVEVVGSGVWKLKQQEEHSIKMGLGSSED